MNKLSQIPDYDSFRQQAMAIFPDGDLKKGYERMCNHISLFKDEKGEPLTYDFILEKFKACHEQWKFRYASKEAKGYLSAQADTQRYCFDAFIDQKIYNQEFVIAVGNSERKRYLFGDFCPEYLQQQLTIFLKSFQNGNA